MLKVKVTRASNLNNVIQSRVLLQQVQKVQSDVKTGSEPVFDFMAQFDVPDENIPLQITLQNEQTGEQIIQYAIDLTESD